MYLLDTNIWFERLLNQARASDVAAFLDAVNPSDLALSDSSLHSIGVILGRTRRLAVLEQFVADLFPQGGVTLLTLTGFYTSTSVAAGFAVQDLLSRLYSASNDFRVDYLQEAETRRGQALASATEAQLYWVVNDYRTRFMNDAFIRQLKLPPEIENNMRLRQFRPDLLMYNGAPGPSRRPDVRSTEIRSPRRYKLFLNPEFN